MKRRVSKGLKDGIYESTIKVENRSFHAQGAGEVMLKWFASERRAAPFRTSCSKVRCTATTAR